MRNQLAEDLRAGRFVVTFEFVTPPRRVTPPLALAPALELARGAAADERIAAIAVTDRVKTDFDHDPWLMAQPIGLAMGKQPLVHLSGKGRSPEDFQAALRRCTAAGLRNLLLVTGDKLKSQEAPARYLDSVDMLAAARAFDPDLLLAGAVSPFKYCEEECVLQYLKATKKVLAGADLLVTQVGWDPAKQRELLAFLRRRGLRLPVLANLMNLGARAARFLHGGKVPGVVVSDDLLRKVEEESAAEDEGRGASLRRLAMQVVGARLMGYAGVQVTGVHSYRRAAVLQDLAESLGARLPTLEAWEEAWRESLRLHDGSIARVAPSGGFTLTPEGDLPPPAAAPSGGARLKFHLLDAVDRALFHHGTGLQPALAPIVGRVASGSRVDHALTRLERAAKRPLVGCATCGFCRLPYTQYVCPETCPKGLANGPCGGTAANRCEFGDRECIHNARYRLARATGRLAELERLLVPPVPPASRGTCSWAHHYRGDSPRARWLGDRRTATEPGCGGMHDATGEPETRQKPVVP